MTARRGLLLSKLVALVAELERAHVKVIFTNLDVKGYENNLHLIIAKKAVLTLIFCLHFFNRSPQVRQSFPIFVDLQRDQN